MIVSAGPNHAKFFTFNLSDKEVIAQNILLLQVPAKEPIENYVADAAHAFAKDFLKDVRGLIERNLKTGINSNEYMFALERWNYNFAVVPLYSNTIYFRLSTDKDYSMIYHFMEHCYFKEKFYLEFFNQIDEFFGPHTVNEYYLTWHFVKFLL